MARKAKKAKKGPTKKSMGGKSRSKGALVAPHSGLVAPKKSDKAAKPAKKERKRYGAYKLVQTKTTVSGAISDGFSALQELRDEMAEQEGNMSGTPAEHTPKYQVVSDAHSELDQVADNEPHDVSDVLGDIEVTFYEAVPRRKGRGRSRATRLSNATGLLQAAIEALNNVPEDAAHHEDAADLANELDEAANVDVSEWPSMFG